MCGLCGNTCSGVQDHMCPRVQRAKVGISLCWCPPYFPRHCLSLSLKLTNSVRLTGPQAPIIHPPARSSAGVTGVRPCSRLCTCMPGGGGRNSDPTLPALATENCPPPPTLKYCPLRLCTLLRCPCFRKQKTAPPELVEAVLIKFRVP